MKNTLIFAFLSLFATMTYGNVQMNLQVDACHIPWDVGDTDSDTDNEYKYYCEIYPINEIAGVGAVSAWSRTEIKGAPALMYCDIEDYSYTNFDVPAEDEVCTIINDDGTAATTRYWRIERTSTCEVGQTSGRVDVTLEIGCGITRFE